MSSPQPVQARISSTNTQQHGLPSLDDAMATLQRAGLASRHGRQRQPAGLAARDVAEAAAGQHFCARRPRLGRRRSLQHAARRRETRCRRTTDTSSSDAAARRRWCRAPPESFGQEQIATERGAARARHSDPRPGCPSSGVGAHVRALGPTADRGRTLDGALQRRRGRTGRPARDGHVDQRHGRGDPHRGRGDRGTSTASDANDGRRVRKRNADGA